MKEKILRIIGAIITFLVYLGVCIFILAPLFQSVSLMDNLEKTWTNALGVAVTGTVAILVTAIVMLTGALVMMPVIFWWLRPLIKNS